MRLQSTCKVVQATPFTGLSDADWSDRPAETAAGPNILAKIHASRMAQSWGLDSVRAWPLGGANFHFLLLQVAAVPLYLRAWSRAGCQLEPLM